MTRLSSDYATTWIEPSGSSMIQNICRITLSGRAGGWDGTAFNFNPRGACRLDLAVQYYSSLLGHVACSYTQVIWTFKFSFLTNNSIWPNWEGDNRGKGAEKECRNLYQTGLPKPSPVHFLRPLPFQRPSPGTSHFH